MAITNQMIPTAANGGPYCLPAITCTEGTTTAQTTSAIATVGVVNTLTNASTNSVYDLGQKFTGDHSEVFDRHAEYRVQGLPGAPS